MFKLTGNRLPELCIETRNLLIEIKLSDMTVEFEELCRLVGLIPAHEAWNPRYRTVMKKVLNATAALDHFTEVPVLTQDHFDRIKYKGTDQTVTGARGYTSRIVVTATGDVA